MRGLKTITKGELERMCSGNMRPELRETINGAELFVADGFYANPQQCPSVCGVDPAEYPFGCFVTMWWLSKDGETFDQGSYIVCDAFHDTGMSPDNKRLARLDSALQKALEESANAIKN